MQDQETKREFQTINRGYSRVFRAGRLSIGLVVPLENYASAPVPSMTDHRERIRLAEQLGFSAVWLRDVPFNVPSFGDAGHLYDPFTYLGYLAASTDDIALGVASIVLPLRHPAHVAKAAASADQLSGGRLILGVASGDRPEEYPAMNQSFHDRGERFRSSYDYIQRMWQTEPEFSNACGRVSGGMDMLPKPVSGRFPMLITGASQQSPEWLAEHGDGWMLYPRELGLQTQIIDRWRQATQAAGRHPQPAMQPLYIDLLDDDNARAEPIHLGYRLGINSLRRYLQTLQAIGINHVALNLRFNKADTETTLKRLADQILQDFS